MIYDNTALIYAAKYGYKEIVELLLKQEGIDINIKNILFKAIHKIKNNFLLYLSFC